MKAEDVKKIAVMGAGDMGHGIAEVALLSGYNVALIDIEQKFVDKGLGRVKESLVKLAEKGKITEDNHKGMLGKIETFVDLEKAVKDVDFVIEAVSEVMSIKKDLFQKLDKFTPKDTVLASNTSYMSVTKIAEATEKPDKVVGMHFFNPVVIMKLVEVIRGAMTSEETMQLCYDIALKLGKEPVRIEKDTVGFIFNRIGAPVRLLFCEIVNKGLAEPEEIDAVMKKSGAPMGPFELMDFVGIDVVCQGRAFLAEGLSPEYKVPKWLQEKIDAGNFGKKTGKGIYDWSQGRPSIDLEKAKKDLDPSVVIAVQVNEATKLLEEGVARSPEDVDKAMINGGGAAAGPFQLGREKGFDKLAKMCEELAEKYGLESLKPTETLKKGNI